MRGTKGPTETRSFTGRLAKKRQANHLKRNYVLCLDSGEILYSRAHVLKGRHSLKQRLKLSHLSQY